MQSFLPIVTYDKLLQPYALKLRQRFRRSVLKELELLSGRQQLCDCCNNHLYYGLHFIDNQWVFREYLPNALQVYIYGDFSYWKVEPQYALHPIGEGNWEIVLPPSYMCHGTLYRLWVVWRDGAGDRLPAYGRRMVQDLHTKIFSAEVWQPATAWHWQHSSPARPSHPLIYEAHIGMSSQQPKVSSYTEFRIEVLPRIAQLGYNTLQLMAIQEHPYYGSFGYQVANFFAPSSRFGTPEELKQLIDDAHALGISVILDVVHSHSVSNEKEGLSNIDGSSALYFHTGEKGQHPVWNSRCFNYGNNDTIMFLLSNLKYWLEEFCFDGFRFDGVTSMIYWNHGIGVDFVDYAQYFDENVDEDALVYLFLANKLVHQVNKQAFTIAEDVSGMPGLAFPAAQQGIGFDYRMSMGIADFWGKMVKQKRDEDWSVGEIYYRLTDKRNEEHVIGYAESHDQAMVGDQTLIFRLIGRKMYDKMSIFTPDLQVDRGIALHKLITATTLTLSDGGFLNFMGNEFGHPEWIDFPREGNNWSYQYARRQWSLADDHLLKYQYLKKCNHDLVHLVAEKNMLDFPPVPLVRDEGNHILVFMRGKWLFAMNFHPERSFENFTIYCSSGKYKIIFDGDDATYGGFQRIDTQLDYDSIQGVLKLYLPSRTVCILERSTEL